MHICMNTCMYPCVCIYVYNVWACGVYFPSPHFDSPPPSPFRFPFPPPPIFPVVPCRASAIDETPPCPIPQFFQFVRTRKHRYLICLRLPRSVWEYADFSSDTDKTPLYPMCPDIPAVVHAQTPPFPMFCCARATTAIPEVYEIRFRVEGFQPETAYPSRGLISQVRAAEYRYITFSGCSGLCARANTAISQFLYSPEPFGRLRS